jgi:hypothetical protein
MSYSLSSRKGRALPHGSNIENGTERVRKLTLFLAVLFPVALDVAAERPWRTLDEGVPIAQIGKGIALVFSPDLAVPGNREFYERLGFTYIETPSWNEALRELESVSGSVHLMITETHGTNGHGLKLQLGPEPGAARSYISLGGLQERLEEAGIGTAVIGACNSGRLFRPGIYEVLTPVEDEPLFLPATLGIIDASQSFQRETSPVRMLRREDSNLETLMEAEVRELGLATRRVLTGRGLREGSRFIISMMLIQMLLGDEALELTAEGYVDELSRKDFRPEERETYFQQFVASMESLARRERTSL